MTGDRGGSAGRPGAEAVTGRLGGLAFGGDYNPEQWDEPVWCEDDRLMRRAHVNLATVGVFSWALLEPEPGAYDFGWLDAHLDRLHANGVAVDLATPTASPPPWFTLAHPDAMPVTADGTRLVHGSRDTYCLAAPAYRSAARRVAAALAARYGRHPAVACWHVHNEYATVCHCDHAAAAFRDWLRARHGGLDALNRAWGTAFWSQRYTAWEQVLPPRATQWRGNPGQLLDHRRFWSDLALTAYREQRDAIRGHSDRPVTTNLMLPGYQVLDLWAFGREVDFVGIDHYPDAPGLDAAADTAFGADRARSFGGGRPWLLIEQGTSTVYAGDRTLPKEPGDILAHTVGHIARGSEGALFFQWRQSAAGAEMWHSAMVPHAGEHTRVFRETAAAGQAVARLAEVAGSTVTAQVAIVHDADVWWALDVPSLPSAAAGDHPGALRRAHRALWDAGLTADFVRPDDPDLGRYRAVLAPSLYLVSQRAADRLAGYVAGGGRLLVEFFAGAVDPDGRVWPGGAPGPLRDLLGVVCEEQRPLAAGACVPLVDGDGGADGTDGTDGGGAGGLGSVLGGGRGTVWSEYLTARGARTVVSYGAGALAGRPAVTRNAVGAGSAWYVSTRLDDRAYAAAVAAVLREAGAGPEVAGLPAGVEAVRRGTPDGRAWLFLVNHGEQAVRVAASGHELLADRPVGGDGLVLPGRAAAVVRERRS